jgi:hypothetical protein
MTNPGLQLVRQAVRSGVRAWMCVCGFERRCVYVCMEYPTVGACSVGVCGCVRACVSECVECAECVRSAPLAACLLVAMVVEVVEVVLVVVVPALGRFPRVDNERYMQLRRLFTSPMPLTGPFLDRPRRVVARARGGGQCRGGPVRGKSLDAKTRGDRLMAVGCVGCVGCVLAASGCVVGGQASTVRTLYRCCIVEAGGRTMAI